MKYRNTQIKKSIFIGIQKTKTMNLSEFKHEKNWYLSELAWVCGKSDRLVAGLATEVDDWAD